jgi:hypothetical protein
VGSIKWLRANYLLNGAGDFSAEAGNLIEGAGNVAPGEWGQPGPTFIVPSLLCARRSVASDPRGYRKRGAGAPPDRANGPPTGAARPQARAASALDRGQPEEGYLIADEATREAAETLLRRELPAPQGERVQHEDWDEHPASLAWDKMLAKLATDADAELDVFS